MSFTKLFIHCIFATKNRENLLIEKCEIRVQSYITRIVESYNCKTLAINNVGDHMHILINLHPSISISELMKNIKGLSSKFINENHLSYGKFSRGEGYGCFSYSEDKLQNVINYIINQKEHHKESRSDDTIF